MSENKVNSNDFRRALSCFATGVAVVTALDADGKKVGITVNSFNSVSLNPPLVLWSIGEDSMSYSVFTTAEHFAVNVLAMHQDGLSAKFANRGGNKFTGLDCRDGIAGVPVLPEYAACFECKTESIFDGGDHKIIVGRVLKFDDSETQPLILYRGRFLGKGDPYADGA
jgi:3-hydroxy-9,10-secoandrosta-1,3,5(10)-triene-9,17-dione monooxygenase reductase component